MENYISNMPGWVSILFVASFTIPIALIANTAKQAALKSGMSNEKSKNIRLSIIGFYTLWLIYASVLSLKGVLYVNTVPPKVILFTALPLVVILFGIISNTSIFKILLANTSLESLIRIHIFRLIGVFFILIYFYDFLPAKFALVAGLGDIATALVSIVAAKAVAQKKSWSIKFAYAWNIFGLLDIISVIVSAIILAKITMVNHELGNLEMTLFPFVWIPAFAPATILFLHFNIFRKLRQVTKD